MGTVATTLGFPRVGARRELKRALESHWAGELTAASLEREAAGLRARHWRLQAELGVDHVPSGDFSLYDHVLDTAVLLGAIPERFLGVGEGAERYFAMARGAVVDGRAVPALEMTKWFDTNYHYLVPELDASQRFTRSSTKPLDEHAEALALGVATRPVLLGPVSFLLLSKFTGTRGTALDLLDRATAVYAEVLGELSAAGASWVQLDEPVLCTDLDDDGRDALARAYATLRAAAPSLRILVATYFSGLRGNLPVALGLPVDALHLDAVADPGQVEDAVVAAPDRLALSLGVVDGRNVWRTDLAAALDRLEPVRRRLGPDRLLLGPSCSLAHLPVDLALEEAMDPEIRSWLAFATQRVEEVVLLKRGLEEGREAVADALADAGAALEARRVSPRVHVASVAARLARHDPSLERRQHPYAERRAAQRARLGLPVLPTTTIGSFPQSREVRAARARYRRGEVDRATYDREIRGFVDEAIACQEAAGLDVLVHGEAERNDMVEHFGELLEGFCVTEHGWVQSYGSRCVKPPVLFGDVHRPRPMTVEVARYASSRTSRPVKGMLTGPVTMLAWSFVRDDEPLEVTARQLAYAIRDEVADLEAVGIAVVQVDEPALRELLPLHAADRAHYLSWAVGAFKLASSGVRDDTQVHTHMCYGEFEDVVDAIVAFDADVVSIEASRSKMGLLPLLAGGRCPNEIGPGVFDVHVPRVPSTEEIAGLVRAALEVVPADRLWVNPDCGLKTRTWGEVRPALSNLVAATRQVRGELAGM